MVEQECSAAADVIAHLFPANRSMEYLISDVYLKFEIYLYNISKYASLKCLFLITVTFLNAPVTFGMLTFVPYVNSTLRMESHMSL